MNSFQITRVAALLAVIFAAGVFTGHMITPKARYIVVGPNGHAITAETVLANFQRQTTLTPEQEIEMRAVLQKLELEIGAIPPMSEARLPVFRRAFPKIRAVLRPEQMEVADRYEKDIERKFENARRHGMLK
jgi:hypothetical protein